MLYVMLYVHTYVVVMFVSISSAIHFQIGGVKHTKTGTLPHHLKSVMGQANLRVARGELEEAIKICMEVIRQGEGYCVEMGPVDCMYDRDLYAHECFGTHFTTSII